MDGTANQPLRLLRRCKKKRQRGQAITEYLLLTIIAIGFARFIFFHPEFGLYGLLNSGMLRLGSALEQNLKTGTSPAARGNSSGDPFSGTSSWNN